MTFMSNLYPDIKIQDHGSWVAIGQKQTLNGNNINPDITLELKVGDIVRIRTRYYSTSPVIFNKYFEKQEPEYAPHSQSFTCDFALQCGVVLTGIVTRIYKVPNRDTMVIPNDEEALKHVSFHYGFEADFNDGKSFYRLRVNSNLILAYINVYKWVPDLKLP